MFDPRRLIREVQTRPCLWDLKDKNYTNRSMRRIAWDQIAKELNIEWNSYTVTCKKEIVNDIQSRWKHIKDYYLREKKKNNQLDTNSMLKNKVPLYFDMLGFLEGLADNRPKDYKPITDYSNVKTINSNIPNIDVDSFLVTLPKNPSSPTTCENISTLFQTSLPNEIELKNSSGDDPDKDFLMSLLPEIKMMTAKEKFDFKFEILSAIKRIKYDTRLPTVDCQNVCTEHLSSTQYGVAEDSNLNDDFCERLVCIDVRGCHQNMTYCIIKLRSVLLGSFASPI